MVYALALPLHRGCAVRHSRHRCARRERSNPPVCAFAVEACSSEWLLFLIVSNLDIWIVLQLSCRAPEPTCNQWNVIPLMMQRRHIRLQPACWRLTNTHHHWAADNAIFDYLIHLNLCIARAWRWPALLFAMGRPCPTRTIAAIAALGVLCSTQD